MIELQSEYKYEQFLEDIDKIFQYTGDEVKFVMCTECGDTVRVLLEDCSCGHVEGIVKSMMKKVNRK